MFTTLRANEISFWFFNEEAKFATFIGIIDHSAEDFHEFLQGAFYKIHRQLNVEIYPELRATKRKVF
jgi:hypothetical protein